MPLYRLRVPGTLRPIRLIARLHAHRPHRRPVRLSGAPASAKGSPRAGQGVARWSLGVTLTRFGSAFGDFDLEMSVEIERSSLSVSSPRHQSRPAEAKAEDWLCHQGRCQHC